MNIVSLLSCSISSHFRFREWVHFLKHKTIISCRRLVFGHLILNQTWGGHWCADIASGSNIYRNLHISSMTDFHMFDNILCNGFTWPLVGCNDWHMLFLTMWIVCIAIRCVFDEIKLSKRIAENCGWIYSHMDTCNHLLLYIAWKEFDKSNFPLYICYNTDEKLSSLFLVCLSLVWFLICKCIAAVTCRFFKLQAMTFIMWTNVDWVINNLALKVVSRGPSSSRLRYLPRW